MFHLHWRDPAKVGHAGGLYQVLPVGVPFTAANVDRFAHDEPNRAAGAALLALAWRHREALLA